MLLRHGPGAYTPAMRGVAIVAVLAGCGRLGFDPVPGLEPIGVRGVRHGTTGFGTEVEVVLPVAVAPEHTFLVFGVGVNDVTATGTLIRGQLLDEQRLRFSRFAFTGLPVVAQWSVVELGESSFVQRGSSGGGTEAIAIEPVDRDESFVLASIEMDGLDLDNEDFVRLELADEATLQLAAPLAPTATLDWQVVSIPGAIVTHGVLDLPGTLATAALPPGDYTSSFVILTWSIAPGLAGNIGPDLVIGNLVDGQLVVERGVAGEPIVVAYQVVTLPGALVLRGSATPNQDAQIFSFVPGDRWDPARTFGLSGSFSNGGLTTFVGDPATDNPGGAWFTTDVSDGRVLELVREAIYPPGTSTRVPYQIIELPFAP